MAQVQNLDTQRQGLVLLLRCMPCHGLMRPVEATQDTLDRRLHVGEAPEPAAKGHAPEGCHVWVTCRHLENVMREDQQQLGGVLGACCWSRVEMASMLLSYGLTLTGRTRG